MAGVGVSGSFKAKNNSFIYTSLVGANIISKNFLRTLTYSKNRMHVQSAKNHRKCHRFWLCLRHTEVLMSKIQMSASEKINLMALIQTLTISTTMFKRMKEKRYGFWQTVYKNHHFSLFNRLAKVLKLGAFKKYFRGN